MLYITIAIVFALMANAIIAFVVAFFWQAKVILTLFGVSDLTAAHVPWKALANPRSLQNNLGRFIAGEIFPELRRKWLKAVKYVAISFVILFLFTGLLGLFAPQILS